MGLDNGIIIESENWVKIPFWVKAISPEVWFNSVNKEHKFETELCYWRKCWPLRHAIIEMVSKDNTEEFHYNLTCDDIDKIIEYIKQNYNKKNFEENISGGYWEWDSFRRHERRQYIRNLYFIKNYLKKNPDAKAFFYDSY